jgi:hypothetical protein
MQQKSARRMRQLGRLDIGEAPARKSWLAIWGRARGRESRRLQYRARVEGNHGPGSLDRRFADPK